ncbi:MAG: response regulator transcription factor [Alphaproteobacteria bacterium]|uniref:Response regulator transcription factor n=1 Tax=Candidatus Nitrobium versatile TaxID=2884831 RepID=A0A953M082_9BACT|nr:response regulator transcription factor [Candidatus Nitrobium versatile]
MIRILIADDHPIVRLGWGKIISKDAGIIVAGEAENAREVKDFLRQKGCDVVVLDISMPDMNGLELLEQLKREYPRLPVIILSMHPEEQYAMRAFKLGASGYITKQSAPEELVKAIKKVASGKKYVSQSFAENLLCSFEGKAAQPLHEKLSIREFQVMLMIASGGKPKEIAQHLCISVKTVNSYRARIFDKVRVRSTAELTRYALENNLLD